MGHHDEYGKQVLYAACGNDFESKGAAVKVDYGPRGGARIDGVVRKQIAVEIEARVSKQVRGAVLDLICHSCSKKLLILMAENMDPELCSEQCTNIMAKFIQRRDFQVVVLSGSGKGPMLENDVQIVRSAVASFGI